MTPPQNRKRNTPTTPRPTLRTVTLEAFKSVQAATIELGQLTVLVGPNSSGKSTLIDSLMMRSQTKLDDPQGTRVDLNGEYIRLGAVSDIVNVNIDTNGFSTGGTLTIHPDQLKLLIRGRLGMLGPSRGRQQVADSRSASTDLQPHLHTLASDHYFVRAVRAGSCSS